MEGERRRAGGAATETERGAHGRAATPPPTSLRPPARRPTVS